MNPERKNSSQCYLGRRKGLLKTVGSSRDPSQPTLIKVTLLRKKKMKRIGQLPTPIVYSASCIWGFFI